MFQCCKYLCTKLLQSCPTLYDPTDRSPPGFSVYHQLPELLKFLSVESVMPSNHLIFIRPLLILPDSPYNSTGMGCQARLQVIFPTQGSNPYLLRLLH